MRQRSILQRSKVIVAKHGCTQKTISSAQVKFRIIVSLIQVIGQLGVVFSIPYPEFYKDLVSVLGMFSLDFIELMPLKCSVAFNHDHFLLIRTLVPLFVALLAFSLRWQLRVSAERKRQLKLKDKAAADDAVADQLFTVVFVIFYLLYPSTSSNIFATFQCETLDNPERSSFLRNDFSVDCKSPFHQIMIVYAWVMVFVYPFGIPALYAYLLFVKHGKEMKLLQSLEVERNALIDEQSAASVLNSARQNLRKAKTSSVWSDADLAGARGSFDLPSPGKRSSDYTAAELKIARLEREEDTLKRKLPDYVQKLILGYELRTYYFELIECFRKLAIVCLPVFFQPSGSVSQLIFGLLVCFLTFGAHMVYAPYIEDNDDRLAQLCQVQIFFSLLVSIALKYDTGTLRNATNIDVLLTVLTILPISIGFILETPFFDVVSDREKRAAALKIIGPLQKNRPMMRWASTKAAAAITRSRTSLHRRAPKVYYGSAASTTVPPLDPREPADEEQGMDEAEISISVEPPSTGSACGSNPAEARRNSAASPEQKVNEKLTQLRIKRLDPSDLRERAHKSLSPVLNPAYIQRQRSRSDLDLEESPSAGVGGDAPSSPTCGKPIVRRKQTVKQFMDDSKKAVVYGLDI